ncbi:MAG: hypothetical protein KDA99_17760 [Planctomycetales bacterium]|nr:hypothetical protein [Planctomycetales bacterium]
MKSTTPKESVNEIRLRLPNDGRSFELRDAVDSLHDFYVNVRYNDCDDDSIVAVAGRFGERPNRRFDIGLYRLFGLTTRMEICLQYPITLRCLLLKQAIGHCESPNDAEQFFSAVRASRWYRRFASLSANACIVRTLGKDEMGEMFRSVMPKLIDVLGAQLRTPSSECGGSHT